MEFTPKQMYPSKKWGLNEADGLKLLKSLGLAVAGFILVWLGDVLIPGISFPSLWAPFIGAMGPVLVNAGRKLAAGRST